MLFSFFEAEDVCQKRPETVAKDNITIVIIQLSLKSYVAKMLKVPLSN
jgi:serine/threonine protein phosphatase PrpC